MSEERVSKKRARDTAFEEAKTHGDVKRFCMDNIADIQWAQKAAAYLPSYEGCREVIWLYGASGVGKSTTPWKYLKKLGHGVFIKKPHTKFHEGYLGEPVVIWDEYSSDMPLGDFLHLTSTIPTKVEVKGAAMPWNCRLLVITSNESPFENYCQAREKNADKDTAFRRRFKKYYLDEETSYEDIEKILDSHINVLNDKI